MLTFITFFSTFLTYDFLEVLLKYFFLFYLSYLIMDKMLGNTITSNSILLEYAYNCCDF